LREQGRWELEEVGARAANDPARLYRLAQFAHDLGEPQLGIRYAVEARRATGEPLHAQPLLLQRAIMPLPYPDLILANAEQHGLDPLLIAALIRQESTFSASARSSANALGLAQVLPSTGRAIARALGRSDFTADDLLRPIVSVELGAHHLASQLTAFDGLTYPALAAYNAGGGPVNGWLRQFGAADVDLFAERIPYPETSDYVQVVYENYRLYRRLYGD
jgi:soluble lytic murein transglycosylase